MQLQHIDQTLARRKEVDAAYRELLKVVKGIRMMWGTGEEVANYAYFPILVEADYPMDRGALYQKLRDNNIYARRYFYPLISDFPMYRGLPSAHRENLPVATDVALKVLCLSIYPALTQNDQQFITGLIREI